MRVCVRAPCGKLELHAVHFVVALRLGHDGVALEFGTQVQRAFGLSSAADGYKSVEESLFLTAGMRT